MARVPADDAPLAEAALPLCFARDTPCSLGVTAPRQAGVAYEDDKTHWRSCLGKEDCPRCYFERGFQGELRRGGRDGEADESKAWSSKFCFEHPTCGKRTWLCVAPYSWGRWGVGCWVCAHFPADYCSSFYRLEVCTRDCLGVSAFQKHSGTKSHRSALQKMIASLQESSAAGCGVLSGSGETVPRLDKFHLAGTVVSRHDTYQDYTAYIQSVALTSALPQQGHDVSQRVCQQMIFCLAEPLRLQDREVMAKATVGSITLDVRDNLMLVLARWFYADLRGNPYLPASGVYEHLLGVVRGQPGPHSGAQAVNYILKAACSRRRGLREPGSGHGAEDEVDEELLQHVKAKITSVVADGGPAEQSALTSLELPNLNMIARDRAHRSRSIMKAIWEPLNSMCGGLLSMFTTEAQSVSRMLKNSSKYSCLFEAQLENQASWWRSVKNLSFAGQRFDSLTTPLFKIFTLLPSTLKFLAELTKSGDTEDQQWARRILEALLSRSGGENLVKAAVVGDALLVVQSFLRLDDRSESMVFLKAREVHDALHNLRVMFADHGVFSAAGGDTLTQKALKYSRDIGVINYWENGRPVAGMLSAADPANLRQHATTIFDLAKGFFDSYFPAFEHVNAFAAFDLEAGLPWEHWRQLVHALAVQEGVSPESLWTLGPVIKAENGPKLGLFARAFFYFRNPAISASAPIQVRQVHSQRWALEGRSAVAWLRALTELTKEQRESRPLACMVLQKSLSLLTGTQTVERWLGEVQATELKQRAQHLCNWNLESAIKLNLQCFQGRRVGKAFQPAELFEGPLDSSLRQGCPVRHKASKYGLQVQKIYQDFFGERRLPGRCLEGKPTRCGEKPRLGNVKKIREVASIAGEMRKHGSAVKAVVAESQAQSSWEPMVQSIRDVAQARVSQEGNPAGSSGSKRKADSCDGDPGAKAPRLGQEEVRKKKEDVAKEAPPGACIPYVDSKGGVYGARVPAPDPTATCAPALPDLVKLLPGNDSVAIPRWSRYLAAANVEASHVVLINDMQADFFSPAALLARLWGKRLADKAWALAKMRGGHCLAFGAALQSHLYLYLHESFGEQHGQHQEVLLRACESFSQKSTRKCLQVVVGDLPAKPKHPRLSFQVVSQDFSTKNLEFKDKVRNCLTLEQCFNRLTEVQRC